MKILARNLMILASAGSGKTYQLGNRIIGLVAVKDVDPERIVAMTFTRKAAGEFADSVLTKLAQATLNPDKAARLEADLGEAVAVVPVLERIVGALPRLQLSTMDGFFTRVVRGFQYELGITGGTFDLIEGPRLDTAMAEIVGGVLGGMLLEGEEETAEEFLHAFRRATSGKEGQGVVSSVEEFLKRWHWIWKSEVPLDGWGGALVWGELPEVGAWEEEKGALIKALRSASDNKDIGKLLDIFERHTIGSGKLGTAGVAFQRILEQVPSQGAIEIKVRRSTLAFDAAASQKWRELYALAAGCEMAAAVSRTRAVGELIARVDGECERRLRRRGLLGFDDVKQLMGDWTRSEEARLRRELVDFRLDARYDHWLLDEFQDTSAAEWAGVEPLLDEAAGEGDGSLFVVGDRKQAIYGWRGGDVQLFDLVEEKYGGDLTIETMPVSYRSCPAVLELVNRVCGSAGVLEGLFGAGVVERWEWEDHESAKPEVGGCARVEEVAGDEMGQRLVELLREAGVGERELSCGVLVRTNKQVRETAALLREEGFDVIEEGRRLPVEDNAVGVALKFLIRWLADPADAYARQVIEMSPLVKGLAESYGGHPWAQWEGALAVSQNEGYAVMAEKLLEPVWDDLSAFSRRRAGDVLGALAEYDRGASSTAHGARDWISRLEVAQAPGAAAVQVMTVHKSKGLGFDVVVLPDLDDRQVPDRGNFTVARGGSDWVLQPPAGWVRQLLPDLKVAEEMWAADQCYEAVCLLYVALTRAKRGLYVLLPREPKSRKDGESHASLANLVRLSAGSEFCTGDESWSADVGARKVAAKGSGSSLGQAVPKRKRRTPSSDKVAASSGGGAGKRFGREVHELFESIAWLAPGEVPKMPYSGAGKLVEESLAVPEVHTLLESPAEGVEFYREQGIEVLLDEAWVSGVIDRLHLGKDSAEVIDFKTDAVESAEELTERYRGQMETYRRAVAQIFNIPEEKVRCLLVWVKGAESAVVEVR